MKTQYYTATSLDGFIATEDDSLDWLFALGDPNDTSYPAFIAGVGALAMGAATYEWILRHADKVAAETGSPWPYTQPAWIFSSRVLPEIEGARRPQSQVRGWSAFHEFQRALLVKVKVADLGPFEHQHHGRLTIRGRPGDDAIVSPAVPDIGQEDMDAGRTVRFVGVEIDLDELAAEFGDSCHDPITLRTAEWLEARLQHRFGRASRGLA